MSDPRATDNKRSGQAQASVPYPKGVEVIDQTHPANPSPPLSEGNRPKPINPQSLAFPDGGRRAWLTVFGAWLTLFSTFGYINSFGVYHDYYTRVFLSNNSPSAIGWIGSIQIALVHKMSLLYGQLLDMGYFRELISVGCLIYVVSQFMLSLAQPHHYNQVFLSQDIGVGVGQGFIFTPTVNIASHHFRRRRALATGLSVSGTSVGGVVFPIMLNKLFDNPSVGFAWGVRASTFMVLGLLVVGNLLMSTRLPNRRQREAAGIVTPRPNRIGMLTDGIYMIALAGCFLIAIGIFFPVFYIQLFAIKHDVSPTLAFYTVSIINAASVFGRTVPNTLADKYGPFNLLIPFCTATSVLIFALLGVKSEASIVVFCILYGFFSGAYFSLMAPMIASILTSMHEIGIRVGLAFFACGFAMLAGTPVSGALLGDSYAWWRPAVFNGVLTLAGCGLLVIARHLIANKKGSPFV